MKHTVILFLLVIISRIGQSQNLISNPSFDIITQCPTDRGPTMVARTMPPWFSVRDYPAIPIPQNLNCPNALEQKPRTGNGLIGLGVYYSCCNYAHEYIGTTLLKPLEKDKNYFIRFYVTPRQLWYKTITGRVSHTCYSDGIGLLLTDSVPSLIYADIVAQPGVENTNGIIKDTTKWTPICGVYKAKGTEKHAIIGNFKKQSDTKSVNDANIINLRFANLLLDDVEVRPLKDLLPDTLIVCKGESKQLNAAFLDGKYKWNTGTTDSIITVSKQGTYTVSITMDGCSFTDSTVVVVPDRTDALPVDTSLCKGDTLRLAVNFPAVGTYKWTTNSTDYGIWVNKSGNYAVSVTNRCVSFTKNFKVDFKTCKCMPFMPTAFSPNNDNINDFFEAYWGCDFPYKIRRFQIYNRWGNLIFNQIEPDYARWDGKIKEQMGQPDLYVWVLEFEFLREGKTENVLISGGVTLVN